MKIPFILDTRDETFINKFNKVEPTVVELLKQWWNRENLAIKMVSQFGSNVGKLDGQGRI